MTRFLYLLIVLITFTSCDFNSREKAEIKQKIETLKSRINTSELYDRDLRKKSIELSVNESFEELSSAKKDLRYKMELIDKRRRELKKQILIDELEIRKLELKLAQL